MLSQQIDVLRGRLRESLVIPERRDNLGAQVAGMLRRPKVPFGADLCRQ